MTSKKNAASKAVQAEPCQKQMAIDQLADTIDQALLKVCSLICHTYGESGNPFRNMCGDYQDAYLWTVSELIHDAKKAWDAMVELERKGGAA